MFEKIALKVFSRLLSEYFHDIDQQQLHISLKSGTLSLPSLRVRSSAFSGLAPFSLLAGTALDVNISLPWQRLSSRPSRVHIRSLSLVFAVDRQCAPPTSLYHHRNVLDRVKKLAKDSMDPKSLTARLLAKIVANLQLDVEQVSLRIVDRWSGAPSAALGVLGRSLRVQSTDQAWKVKMASSKDAVLYKLLSARSLAVYYDAQCDVLDGDVASVAAHLNAAQRAVLWCDDAAPPADQSARWLVEPSGVALRVTWPQTLLGGDCVQLNASIERLAVGVTPNALETMCSLSGAVVAHHRRLFYAHLKPLTLATPADRWKFVCRAVLFRVRDRDGTLRRTWPALRQFAAQRRHYMSLWRRFQVEGDDPLLVDQLIVAERQLANRDIVLFRRLALSRAQREQTKERRLRSSSSSAGALKHEQRRLRSSTSSTLDAPEKRSKTRRFARAVARKLSRNKTGDVAAVSESEVHQLVDAVAEDVSQLDATSATTLQVSFELEHASVRIFDPQQSEQPLVEALASRVSLFFDAHRQAVGVGAKLGSFHVLRFNPPNASFAQLVGLSASLSASSVPSTSQAMLSIDARVESSACSLAQLVSLLDASAIRAARVRLIVNVRPVDVLADVDVLRQVLDAYLTPSLLTRVLALLSARVWAKPRSSRSSRQLSSMPQLNVQCVCNAPNVFLPSLAALRGEPSDADAQPTLLIAHFGRLSVVSAPRDVSTAPDEQSLAVNLNSLSVSVANRLDAANERAILKQCDVQAALELIVADKLGLRGQIGVDLLEARFAERDVECAAKIVSDALVTLVDKRSRLWHFVQTLWTSGGVAQRRRAKRAQRRAQAGRTRLDLQTLVREAQLEVLNADLAPVLRATAAHLALCVNRQSRAAILIKCAANSVSVDDLAEGARQKSAFQSLFSTSSVVMLTVERKENDAATYIDVDMSDATLAGCVNRETVLYVADLVSKLLLAVSDTVVVQKDLRSRRAVAKVPLNAKLALNSATLVLNNAGQALCSVELQDFCFRGSRNCAGGVEASVELASFALVVERARLVHTRATLRWARATQADSFRVSAELEQARVLVVAQFAVQLWRWLDEFAAMRRLVTQMSRSLTTFVKEKSGGAPILYSCVLRRAALIVPQLNAGSTRRLLAECETLRVENAIDGGGDTERVTMRGDAFVVCAEFDDAERFEIVDARGGTHSFVVTRPLGGATAPVCVRVECGDIARIALSMHVLRLVCDCVDGNVSQEPFQIGGGDGGSDGGGQRTLRRESQQQRAGDDTFFSADEIDAASLDVRVSWQSGTSIRFVENGDVWLALESSATLVHALANENRSLAAHITAATLRAVQDGTTVVSVSDQDDRDASPIHVFLLRRQNGGLEVHVRVDAVRGVAPAPLVSKCVEQWRPMLKHMHTVLTRFKQAHFNASLLAKESQDAVIVHLKRPNVLFSATSDTERAFVLSCEALMLQTKIQRENEHRVVALVLAADGVDVVRLAPEPVAIVQPLHIQVDVAVRSSRRMYALVAQSAADTEQWPTASKLVTAHLSLKAARGASQVVFALSRSDAAALSELARAQAGALSSGKAQRRVDSAQAGQLVARLARDATLELDVSSNDSICVRLVLDLTAEARGGNSNSASDRYKLRAESNAMAIGRVSMTRLFAHVTRRRKLAAAVLPIVADAASGELEFLASSDVSLHHYDAKLCRWLCAAERWSLQTTARVKNGRLASLTVHSDTVMQLNVTSALVSLLPALLQPEPATQAAAAAAPTSGSSARKAAYTIANQTGEELWWWLGDKAVPAKLSDGECEILSRDECDETLSLQFVGSRTLSGISVNKLGVFLLNPFVNALDSNDDAAAAAADASARVVVFEVDADQGTRRVRLRSHVTLHNRRSSALEVFVEPSVGARLRGAASTIVAVPAGGKWHVPCQLASGQLTVRPLPDDESEHGGAPTFKLSADRVQLAQLAALDNGTVRCDRVGDSARSCYLKLAVESIGELDAKRRPRVSLDPSSAHAADSSERELLLGFDVAYIGDWSVSLSDRLTVCNRLPCRVRVRLKATDRPTAKVPTPTARIVSETVLASATQESVGMHVAPERALSLQVRVDAYRWSSVASLAKRADNKQLICVHDDERQHTLTLFVDVRRRHGVFEAILYARWWLVAPQLWFRSEAKRVLPRDVALDNSVVLYSDRRVSVGIDDDWSALIDLEAIASAGSIEIERQESATGEKGDVVRVCEFAVRASAARGAFWRTKVLTLAARFVLVNRLPEPLVCIQDCAADANPHHPIVLDAGEQRAVHWESGDAPRRVRVATLTMMAHSAWSGAVPLNGSADAVLRLRKSGNGATPTTLDVRYTLNDGGTVFVAFCASDAGAPPPYRVENRTNLPIAVSQIDSVWPADTVQPHSFVAYALDEPSAASHAVIARVPGSDLAFEFDLDSVAAHEQVQVELAGGGAQAVVFAWTELLDCVRTLVFSFADPSEEWRVLGDAAEAQRAHFVLSLPQVHVSLIDDTPAELCCVTMVDVDLSVTRDSESESVELTVERLQVDNQLRDTPAPTILWARKERKGARTASTATGESVVGASNQLAPHHQPFVRVSVVRALQRSDLDESARRRERVAATPSPSASDASHDRIGNNRGNNVVHLRYASLLLQEFNLSFESAFLLRLTEFVESARRGARANACDNDAVLRALLLLTLQPRLDAAALERVDTRERQASLYFESVQFFPIKARFSYTSVPGTTTQLKQRLSHTIGTLAQYGLANVYQSRLTLSGVLIEHALTTWPVFRAQVIAQYREQLLSNFGAILGASVALGNPLKLAGDVGRGVIDFFVEPAQGIVSGPRQFVAGVGAGTSSLMRNLTQGVSASAFSLGDSLARGVAALSLDKRYVAARRRNRALERPQNVGAGFAYGVRDLSLGVVRGVTGLLADPVRGAQRSGVSGFFRGCGVGLLGVVVKPAVGVVELATRTSEGLLNQSDNNVGRRIRAPRSFDSNGRVVPLAKSLARARASDAQAAAAATRSGTTALAAQVLSDFSLAPTEPLLAHFSCSIIDSVFHTGYLYIFAQHLCFVSILERVCIALVDVSAMKKRSFLGANSRVEVLHGSGASLWILSLNKRDVIFETLMQAWKSDASCFVEKK